MLMAPDVRARMFISVDAPTILTLYVTSTAILSFTVVLDVCVPFVVINDFELGAWSTQDWSGGAAANARVSRPAFCGRYGLSLFQDEAGSPISYNFVDTINFGTGVDVPGYARVCFIIYICLYTFFRSESRD